MAQCYATYLFTAHLEHHFHSSYTQNLCFTWNILIEYLLSLVAGSMEKNDLRGSANTSVPFIIPLCFWVLEIMGCSSRRWMSLYGFRIQKGPPKPRLSFMCCDLCLPSFNIKLLLSPKGRLFTASSYNVVFIIFCEQCSSVFHMEQKQAFLFKGMNG